MTLDPKHASPTAKGFAVMTDTHRGQEIDVLTVSVTERGAMVNWLVAGQMNGRRMMVYSNMADHEIEAAFNNRAAAVCAKVVQVHVMEAVPHG